MDKQLLLVEDFPVIQKLYGTALKGHYFNVDLAPDGAAALEMVGQKEYDFIILDLLLPKVNGIEFLEKFQNRPLQTKVVILSDFKEPKTVDRAYKLGIDAYFVKAETPPSELADKLISLSKQS